MEASDVPSLSSIHSVSQLSACLETGVCMQELEAVCKTLNYPLKGLFPRPLADFSPGKSQEIAMVHQQYYEKKRLYHLSKILKYIHSQHTDSFPQIKTRKKDRNWEKQRENTSISPVLLTENSETNESTEVSVVNSKWDRKERREIAQKRALSVQMTEIEAKIKKIKEKEEKTRKIKEELKNAEEEKQRKLHLRNEKIRENLLKKHKELELFEQKEAQNRSFSLEKYLKSSVRPRCRSVVSRKVTNWPSEEENVQERLMKIQEKLDNSAMRVRERRYIGRLSFAARYDKRRKAQDKVQTEALQQSHHSLELALKLHQKQCKSHQLREEYLHSSLLHSSHRVHSSVSTVRINLPRKSEPIYRENKPIYRKFDTKTRFEIGNLRKMDVEMNLCMEKKRKMMKNMKIIEKHREFGRLKERETQAKSVMESCRLKEDFKKGEERETWRQELTGRIGKLKDKLLFNKI